MYRFRATRVENYSMYANYSWEDILEIKKFLENECNIEFEFDNQTQDEQAEEILESFADYFSDSMPYGAYNGAEVNYCNVEVEQNAPDTNNSIVYTGNSIKEVVSK
jgi:hypothetical protein